MSRRAVASSFAARAVVFVAGLLAWPVVDAKAASVDYLYVESNEGTSSGGHVALRIDDVAYDFQRHEPGVVRLERHDAGDFLREYAFLQNRPVHVSRIAVSDDTKERLRARFNAAMLSGQARFDALAVASEDSRLLAAFADPRGAGRGASIAIPGSGYFFADAVADADTDTVADADGDSDSDTVADAVANTHAELRHDGPPSSGGNTRAAAAAAGVTRNESAARGPGARAVVALRERIARQRGPSWIARRLRDERKNLASLEPGVLSASDLPTGDTDYPRVEGSFSRRYADSRAVVAALDVIAEGMPLRTDAIVTSDDASFALDPREVASLAAFAAGLEEDVAALVTSPRNDWGSAALAGIARLAAVDQSLVSGRVVVLDTFAADAKVLPREAIAKSGALADLVADSIADLDAAKEDLLPAVSAEDAYTRLEGAANRAHELLAAQHGAPGLRVATDAMLPRRAAHFALGEAPHANRAALASNAARAAEVEKVYAGALDERYGYDIARRNCVTEMFRFIDAAMDGDAAVSTARLGGYVAPGSAQTVIPFVSARAVNASYRVVEERLVPSWREQRLASLPGAGTAATALREGNTLTSTVYRPNAEDSVFLFFAGSVATRPLAGLGNLATGIGASALALATLPLRGTAPLVSALRGVLFSLPELAFVQIRRGSFAYVRRSDIHEPAWWPDAGVAEVHP